MKRFYVRSCSNHDISSSVIGRAVVLDFQMAFGGGRLYICMLVD